MKWIKRIVLLVVLLVIVALTIVYFSLNAIVRSTVQSQSQASLNVPTTLGSAHLALFGGEVGINDFTIGSPTGFDAPSLLALKGADVQVSYGQLTKEPIHINKISINNPVFVLQQGNGKINIQAMMDQLPPSKPSEMKMIIDELDINSAHVDIEPGIPGLPHSIPVDLPTIMLKNIGNADGAANGAAMKDVVMQVVTVMASKASASGKLPLDFNTLLNSQLGSISQKLGGDFNKQVQDLTGSLTKSLPGGVGNLLNGAAGNQATQLEQGLGGLLNKNKPPATRP